MSFQVKSSEKVQLSKENATVHKKCKHEPNTDHGKSAKCKINKKLNDRVKRMKV